MSDNVAKYVYWIATGLVALVYLGGRLSTSHPTIWSRACIARC